MAGKPNTGECDICGTRKDSVESYTVGVGGRVNPPEQTERCDDHRP